MTAFAPYAPPLAPPEKPTATGHRRNRTLAAVLWTIALASIASARYALTLF